MSDIRTNQTQNITVYDESGNSAVATPGASPAAYVGVQGYQPAPVASSAVTTVSTVLATAATGYNVATVTLRTFTGTTPSITFGLQASDDNTNWVTLQGINNTTGVVATSWTQASALTAGTAGPSIDYTIGAYTNVRINITAISGTTPSAVFGLGLQSMSYEGSPGIASLPALATGTNSIGTVQPGNTANTTAWLMTQKATITSSGLLIAKVLAAANTTPVSVKTSAAQLYGWHLINNATSTRYVRVFNVASAPTMGTTSPTFVLPLPASGGAVLTPNDIGIPMGTGIFYSITTGAADLDNTAPAANDVVGTLFYI